MIAVVQRVNEARVRVDGRIVGEIGRGLLVLAAIERGDTPDGLRGVAKRLVHLRVFPAELKSFEIDLKAEGGGLLLISNFTVAADTSASRRPSLSGAAPPAEAKILFDQLVEFVREEGIAVATGEFGADMLVESINDGPTTFIVRSK